MLSPFYAPLAAAATLFTKSLSVCVREQKQQTEPAFPLIGSCLNMLETVQCHVLLNYSFMRISLSLSLGTKNFAALFELQIRAQAIPLKTHFRRENGIARWRKVSFSWYWLNYFPNHRVRSKSFRFTKGRSYLKFEEFREEEMSFVPRAGDTKKKQLQREAENAEREREWPRAKMAPQSFIDWEIFAASVAHTARKRYINLSRNYK
jgi:hypothetical protein